MIKQLATLVASQTPGSLLWSFEEGVGIHTGMPLQYDDSYYDNYAYLDDTPMGKCLTSLRLSLARRWHSGSVIDVGVGGGAFTRACECQGYDVNPKAVRMLGSDYANPYDGCEAITCWDSFEHIPDPWVLLSRVKAWVFISMPIYRDMAHVLQSKHYKPGEHLWYFSEAALIKYMGEAGFECVEVNDYESQAGREDILSFAFRRISK